MRLLSTVSQVAVIFSAYEDDSSVDWDVLNIMKYKFTSTFLDVYMKKAIYNTCF
jgi:hypothetical protein